MRPGSGGSLVGGPGEAAELIEAAGLARWLDELAAMQPGDLPSEDLRQAHVAQLRAAATAARAMLDALAKGCGGHELEWLQAESRVLAGQAGQERAARADAGLALQAARAQAIGVLVGALRPALRSLVTFVRQLDGPC